MMAKLWRKLSRPPLWQAGRILFAVSAEQAFLDRAGWIITLAPRSQRRSWALRLLSLSPHYFTYQWDERYSGKSRAEVMEAEHARNAMSRRAICDRLLRPYLKPGMTVLDFGCGPGYLAAEVGKHVAKVLAIDISRGTLACACELNNAPNVHYVSNHLPDLRTIRDASIDFLYSIAVIQHLEKAMTSRFFSEFARVLKPRARALCHFILGPDAPPAPPWKLWFNLRMTYYTQQEIEEMAKHAGFRGVSVAPAGQLAEIDDDVGRQHVALLER